MIVDERMVTYIHSLESSENEIIETMKKSSFSENIASEILEKEGINAAVVNIHTIKPIDKELITASAKKTGKVVTVEEHSIIGGLGSAVCEALAETVPTPVLRIGVQDVFGESGPAKALIAKYGLDAESIYKKVKEYLAK